MTWKHKNTVHKRTITISQPSLLLRGENIFRPEV